MEVKSNSDCLNRVVNMILEKSLTCLVKDDLEDIRKHIEWKQAKVVSRGEYFEERQAVLSVLSQVNDMIERFFSDDTEEELDEEYNTLRKSILEWYEKINTKPEINKRQYYYFKEI